MKIEDLCWQITAGAEKFSSLVRRAKKQKLFSEVARAQFSLVQNQQQHTVATGCSKNDHIKILIFLAIHLYLLVILYFLDKA